MSSKLSDALVNLGGKNLTHREKISVAYYSAFLRLSENTKLSNTGWGNSLIVLGGVLAFLFHPAWLALSCLGLSWVVNSLDTHTRASVVALVDSLEELSDQKLQSMKNPKHPTPSSE